MEEFIVADIMQRGCPLKTQLSNSINWIPNVVFDTYSNKNEFGIIFDDRYSNFVIFIGDTIKVNFVDGTVQYFLETIVTSIRLEAMRIITLKIASVKKIPNLRKYERYSVNYGANIYYSIDTDGVLGIVTNISLAGLGFLSKYTFFVGEVVHISILLPSRSFVLDAEIVRYNETSKGVEYGVVFVNQDKETKATLAQVIEEIKEREDRLSRIAGMDMM